MPLRVKVYRNPNKTERYPCSKRIVKEVFSDCDDLHISFGLTNCFRFDSNTVNRPNLNGPVVASATVDRRKVMLEFKLSRGGSLASIYLYTVSKDFYTDKASKEFLEKVLPWLKKWICENLSKPETAVHGIDKVVIDWDGHSHNLHKIKLRY